MATAYVGIDLGTTTTLISAYTNGKAWAVENKQGKLITPSVVAYDKKDLLLEPSKRGKEPKVGDAALAVRGNNFVTITDAKRIIGRRLYEKEVAKVRGVFAHSLVADANGVAMVQIPTGDPLTTFVNIYPQWVSAEVLKYMVSCYQAKFNDVKHIKAVVTIPAIFSETQRSATYEAARIAQIDIMQLVSEPTAAAVQYLCGDEEHLSDLKGKNGRYLVFDLGGGTLDVSVVEVTENGASILVKAVEGDPLLGGRDFDDILYKFLEAKLKTGFDIDLTVNHATDEKEALARNRARINLLLECRNLKERLSQNIQTEFNTAIFGSWKSDIEETDIEVTRAAFETELLRNDMKSRILKPIIDVLNNNKIPKESVNAVLMAGGGSRMPIIEAWLAQYFERIPIRKAKNVDHVVSQGAAIMANNIRIRETVEATKASRESTPTFQNAASPQAAELENDIKLSFKITDTLALGFGIEVVGNKNSWLIKQHTTVPAKGKGYYTNVYDQQKKVTIKLLQGKSDIASENLLIYTVDLPLTPMPPNQSDIQVEYSMDSSQMITIKVKDTSIPNVVKEGIVPLRGRLDDNSIQRLAEGYLQPENLSESEKALNSLTSDFYRVTSNLRRVSSVIDRKQHLSTISTVESFVLGARGDSIAPDDVKAMQKLLDSVDLSTKAKQTANDDIKLGSSSAQEFVARPRAASAVHAKLPPSFMDAMSAVPKSPPANATLRSSAMHSWKSPAMKRPAQK